MLFRSENRGTSWTTISGDLTRHLDRNKIPIMGKTDWPDDPLLKNRYTTDFGVCTALAESPVKEGLLFYGSDDGLVQISEDGGKNWRKIDTFPGVPDMSFISDICPSNFDADTLFVSIENHQHGDFKPYLLKSTDLGKTWKSIASDLPERHFVWSVVQDFVDKDLLFAGTEFALFFSVDGGGHWVRVNGSPDVAFRDLEIQKRECDLVGATFGRGFYVLDDYSALRGLTPETLSSEAALLPTRDPYIYNENTLAEAPGVYTTPNPPFGANVSFYLRDNLTSGTQIVLTVADSAGKEVRRIDGPRTAGVHRVNWNLRSQPAAGGRGGRGRGGFDDEEEMLAGLSGEARAEMEAEMEAEREAAEAQAPDTDMAFQQQTDTQETSDTQGGGGRRGGRGGAAGARGARGGRGGRGGGGGPLVNPGKFTITLNKVVGTTVTPIGKPITIQTKPLPGAPPLFRPASPAEGQGGQERERETAREKEKD